MTWWLMRLGMKSTFIEGRKHRRSVPTAIGGANRKRVSSMGMCVCPSIQTEARYLIYDATPRYTHIHTHTHKNVYLYVLNTSFCVSTYMPICMCTYYTYIYILIYVRYYMIYVLGPSRASARFCHDGCLQWISSFQIGWMLSLFACTFLHTTYIIITCHCND